MKFKENDYCVVVEDNKCYLGKVLNVSTGYKVQYNGDFWWFNTEHDSTHPLEYAHRDAKIYTIEEFLEQFDLPKLKDDDKVQFFSQDKDAGALCEVHSNGRGVCSIHTSRIDLRISGYTTKRNPSWAVMPLDGTVVVKKDKLVNIGVIDYRKYIGTKAKWVNSNGNVEYEGTINTCRVCPDDVVIRSYDGTRNWAIINGKSRCGNWKVEFIEDKPTTATEEYMNYLAAQSEAPFRLTRRQDGIIYPDNNLEWKASSWQAPSSFSEALTYFNPSQEQMDTVLKQIKQKENKEMSNVRIVTVELIDNTAGIQEAADRVVAVFRDYATMDDNETTIREILMTKDVASDLLAHNEVRATLVNQDILERTGNTVMLQPVKLRDLTWNIKG